MSERRERRTSRALFHLPAGVVTVLFATALVIGVVLPVAAKPAPTTDYIVIVRDGVSPSAVAASIKVKLTNLYQYGVSGFSAALTTAQVSALIGSAQVQSVTPDGVSTFEPLKPVVVPPQPAQTVPIAVARVGTSQSPTAHIDGLPDPMPIDVAVLDSGIDPSHPDLNVVGGVDCGPGSGFQDVEGHGTFVSGLIGARDNAIGYVGVAPDVRLWSVRVGDKAGDIKDKDLLCGLDWVAQHSDVIRVANLSLSGEGTDTGDCGNAATKKDQDPIHQAICHVVGLGVTVVVAAGNESVDASLRTPASYDEVITVSAMTDLDGLPGGLQPVRGPGFCSYDLNAIHPIADDTFVFFSDFGADIDIAAPGVCTGSTYKGGSYTAGSGTSFSAPIVAGAAALYIINHPGATPAQVKQALIDTWEPGPIPGDPDAFPEGIVNVSTF